MGFFLRQKKKKKNEWKTALFKFHSPSWWHIGHRKTAQLWCTGLKLTYSIFFFFLLHSQTKRGADLLSSIVHFKDTGTDEEIMLLTCVSLDIYLQTLKQRHSIRIWSWEIWWRLKWIDTLGVRWWLSAKDNGRTNASCLEHQGWVVETYSTTMSFICIHEVRFLKISSSFLSIIFIYICSFPRLSMINAKIQLHSKM